MVVKLTKNAAPSEGNGDMTLVVRENTGAII